ncbi:hypothetical protein C8Q73DRAFT_788779 [Cubamyces lactineus]|nr:hypothetical protein C8Q73DRAFT_788779 [Cubamyces lactineus]
MGTAEDDPAAHWIDGRTRIPHVGVLHVLAWVKTGVKQCVHNHSRGSTQPNVNIPTFLPTRLINCSDSDCLRIVATDSSTPPERISPIALPKTI